MSGLLISAALLLAVIPGSPASAKKFALPSIACEAAGDTQITPVNALTNHWQTQGTGSCFGTTLGTLTVEFSGTGTSQGLGLCSGNLVVQDLDLTVTLAFFNHRTKVTTLVTEHWGSPVTTYPIAVPFIVSDKSFSDPTTTITGVGTLFDHIFLKCPPGGADSTLYAWTQLYSEA